MKNILGLDLGTNSIGWALVQQDFESKEGKILGMGSRIIPMGTDKQDYEKGVGITKNADRRTKRTIRKMNKRYKLRRNKLLFILHELGMLPNQFQFKNEIPKADKIQNLELLPIQKGTLQLNSLTHYELRAKAINKIVEPKELGKILYSFNQLRGYSGGNNNENSKKEKENNDNDENESVRKYEVLTQKVTIKEVKQSEEKFKGRGKNKEQEFHKFDITVIYEEEKLEGETELQNLAEKLNQEEELEIRIKRNKKGEMTSVVFALPQKTNWRKQMETTEETLKTDKLFVSQLILRDLEQNKWTKIRNRVFLRNRYQEEFDKIWEVQSKEYDFLNNCSKEKLEKIATYLFPGKSDTQQKLKQEAFNRGLKHIIRNQVIYYQRPLKSQTELISKCKFERDEIVLANSHPLFQEFRCWDQINRMYITSKQEVWSDKKKKNIFQYSDRFLTNEEKQKIYDKLQMQKQIGFGEVAKIVNLKNDKTEYLNGLNAKAKLKGCDTTIEIKKKLGEYFEELFKQDHDIVIKIWKALFDNANNGSEYDPNSLKVSSIKDVLKSLNDETATELALKFVQTIKFPRKYSSLSAKAIQNILPLMQLNPTNIPQEIETKFKNIQNLVETGEIINDVDNNLEDYVISFVQSNPKALETGGLMYAFASSLIYGKHTAETIKPQIKNYHDIKYEKRNLRNPIVEQLSNETMQIVKALWKQYKFNPEELEIRIELARDLKNSAKERDSIFKGQIKSQKINETIKKRLSELKQELSPRNIELYKVWSQQNSENYPSPKKANEPTQEEIQKLRLWEEQKCISPYTLKPIPLSKLFSPDRLYDIDHIIPKSRYFDDSLSNKVVCETNINEEKSNRTAWEYISQQNSSLGICSESDYVKYISDVFYGKKKKNLLLEKIPTNPVERQIKDTQYISVAVKRELAKVVGSDNIKTTTGEVTSFLRSRWGLKKLFMELTENRFKQMEFWDLDENGNPKSEWVKRYVDEYGKNKYDIKNWSKRYDNRHHAIDALVVALTQQNHIQRLNNLNKHLQDELTSRKDEFKLEIKEGETVLEAFFNLEEERRKEIQQKIESSRYFESPFSDLMKQAKEYLETMVISIKPKDKLGVKKDDKGNVQLKIRGALHQETNYGKTKDPKTGGLRDTKTINISTLKAKDIPQIIDEVLKKEIDTHRKKYDSMKEAFTGEGLKAFYEGRFQSKSISINKLTKENISIVVNAEIKSFLSELFKDHSGNSLLNEEGLKKFKEKYPKRKKVSIYDSSTLKPPVYKVKVWYSSKDEESTLQRLYEDNEKLSVVTGDNYLFLVMEKEGKRIFDIASLYDSADIAKRALQDKNENIKHQILEDYRIKHKDKPDKVLFSLQQGDLVYLPMDSNEKKTIENFNHDEFNVWFSNQENKKNISNRIYKVAKFTGKDCHFIPHNYANSISVQKELTEEQKDDLKKQYADKKIPKAELNFVEYGSYRDCSPYEAGESFIKNLTEKDKNKKIKLTKIQDTCIKLKIDWLGNITKA
ncbi:MAG: HNH endonuclease domain-containing protein [Bacteroidia bacterium]